jgi:hypothetical protein
MVLLMELRDDQQDPEAHDGYCDDCKEGVEKAAAEQLQKRIEEAEAAYAEAEKRGADRFELKILASAADFARASFATSVADYLRALRIEKKIETLRRVDRK